MIQCIKSTHQQFFTIAVICTIFQVIVFSSLYGSLEQIAEKGRRSIVFLMRMRGEARVTENGSVGSRVGSMIMTAVRLSVLHTSALRKTHGENTLSYKIMCTVIPH